MTNFSNKINKIGFAERLNKALDKEGFPPLNRGRIQLLAEMFDLSHRGVGKWISGQTCPPLKKYPLIAEKLNVSTEWLQTGNGDMVREDSGPLPTANIKQEIPLFRVGDLSIPHKKASTTVTCLVSTVGDAYALKLDSEAMSPRFPPGTIIIVDPGRIAKDGDFVLAEIATLPAIVFRQLLVAGGNKYLNAHNPKFDRILLTQGDKIKGVIIQAVLLFY